MQQSHYAHAGQMRQSPMKNLETILIDRQRARASIHDQFNTSRPTMTHHPQESLSDQDLLIISARIDRVLDHDLPNIEQAHGHESDLHTSVQAAVQELTLIIEKLE